MKENLRVFLLAFALVFTSLLPAGAFGHVSDEAKGRAQIQRLVDRGMIQGYGDGELYLDRTITRAEVAKMLIHSLGLADEAEAYAQKTVSYSDVASGHWARGAIGLASTYSLPNGLSLINGYPDGTFKPDAPISNAEVMKILVLVAKGDLTQADMDQALWPDDYIAWAIQEGILGAKTLIPSLPGEAKALRGDVFIMLDNLGSRLEAVASLGASQKLALERGRSLGQDDHEKQGLQTRSLKRIEGSYERNRDQFMVDFTRAINARVEKIEFTVENLDKERFKQVLEDITWETSKYITVRDELFEGELTKFNQIIITPEYVESLEDILATEDAIKAWVGANIHHGMSDYDKAKAIHDWLAGKADFGDPYVSGKHPMYRHTASSLILYNRGVCEAYSRAFLRAAQLSGLDAIYVSGYVVKDSVKEPHAWNKVRVDGDWYNVDVMWDDYTQTGLGIIYDYFLKGDATMGGHLPEPHISYPRAYSDY